MNIGSIELHTSLHRREELRRPTVLAFDLDPGAGAGLLECCEVALRVRELFAEVGLESFVKTSGSKGLQVYVPLNGEVSYATTKPLSRRVAELLEAQTPGAVVSRMAKALRSGKVLVDWSQNAEHESMVCVYSVARQGAADRLDAGRLGARRGGCRRRRPGAARVRARRRARAGSGERRPVGGPS